MLKQYNIVVLRGDGIGPEIVAEAVKVLDAAGEKFGFRFAYDAQLMGGCAIDATGEPLPQHTVEACKKEDSVLLGAVGGWKWDTLPGSQRPAAGLLGIRSALGLYANLRPAKIFEPLKSASPIKDSIIGDQLDILVVRGRTGGIYFGRPQDRDEGGDRAVDTCTYSRQEIERVLHVAFRLAMSRRRHLTVVDKANVLETSRFWREIAQQLAPQYPEVELDFMFPDNAAPPPIRLPTQIDAIPTENMFGDILTDEASVISGSLGMLPSASVGSEVALFEPIHGSYPQAAGKNIANPMAAILSAAMLLEHLGLTAEGSAVRDAVNRALTEGIVTEDLAAQGERRYSTSEVGDFIAAHI